LRVTARSDAYDFHVRTGGDWQAVLEDADGEILSTRVAGGFVGVTMGPYAHRGD
jgi:alpha-N-arabinofuranosidase